jgi:hypothetical protein
VRDSTPDQASGWEVITILDFPVGLPPLYVSLDGDKRAEIVLYDGSKG